MIFYKENYEIESLSLAGEHIKFRSYRNVCYVENPVCAEFQKMNIFIPEAYYIGECVNGYSALTAPIFMPNTVGGYMPGAIAQPEYISWEKKELPNTIFKALQRGYVVAAPAIRGRTLKDALGAYIGKAPACIVDYKAAVRFLKYIGEDIPGNVSRIITNGTSAGGALSSLMGATGNHPDYEEYLEKIGAAKTSDDVYAASCYCPITNLEYADMAYEWQFEGVDHYDKMSEQQKIVSKELAMDFVNYLNGLKIIDKDGNTLTLDESGNGSFKEYMKKVVLSSVNKAKLLGEDISDKEWITIQADEAIDIDWHKYVVDITRMKMPPAFDALDLHSPENDLFGNTEINCRHFTEYGRKNSYYNGIMAEDKVIKMMNPMNYIDDNVAKKAKYWRIRHGECDRDTSLAISAILARKLEMAGVEVDYHSPWGIPHAGDYDLEELFAWIDHICK